MEIVVSTFGTAINRDNEGFVISTIRKGQLAFTYSSDAIRWMREVLTKKLESQQSILLMMPRRDMQQDELVSRVIPKMEAFKGRMHHLQVIRLLHRAALSDCSPVI